MFGKKRELVRICVFTRVWQIVLCVRFFCTSVTVNAANDRSRSQGASMKPWTTGKHISSFYQTQSFALSELQRKRPLARNTSSCASTSAVNQDSSSEKEMEEWGNIGNRMCGRARANLTARKVAKPDCFLLEVLFNLSFLTIFHSGWMW